MKRVLTAVAVMIAVVAFISAANLIASPKEYPATVTFFGDDRLLPALVKDISAAEESINCSLYMFKTDGNDIDSTHLLLNAMLHALGNNVKLAVIFDIGDEDDLTTEFNLYTGNVLSRAGATVVYDSPDRRLHTKMCVIDDDLLYIGSHNYTFSALKRNAETTVRIRSKEVAAEALEYMRGLGLE